MQRSIVLILMTLASFATAQEPTSVKLGVIASLTGDAAKNGAEWLQGAKLAAEEAGGFGLRIELVVEDDNTNPMKAVSAFNKLIALNKVQGVVGGTWDFVAESLFPLAEKAKIPLVTPTNPIEVFSPPAARNRWVFTNGLSLKAAVEAADRFLTVENVRTIGLVVINVPYGLQHAKRLREALELRGVQVSFEELITYEGFRDGIKVAALKSIKARPDAVFVVLNFAGVDAFLTETARGNYFPLTIMTHTLLEAAAFGGSGERFKRARGLYQPIEDQSFLMRYQARWQGSPIGYAGNGYDAVMCLSRAIAAGAFPVRSDKAYVCDGVTGKHMFSESTRELVQTRARVFRVEQGRLALAQ